MTRRGGLGRGLDALLPAAAERGGEPRAVRTVAVDELEPNPRQPRRAFDDDAARELETSVTQLGILQPLLVRPVAPRRYQLVAGERRWRAARAAGLERVPVLVVETDDRGALERALVENIHREDLNPLEEAAAYRELLDEGGLTQEELGARLGRDRSTIANSLRLLDLPPAIQRLLVTGKLSAGHGRALLGLTGNPFQERLSTRVANEGLSVRATEELVRRYQQLVPRERGSVQESAHSATAIEAERRLAERLGARVSVQMGKRKGKITIEVNSPGELERLVERLSG